MFQLKPEVRTTLENINFIDNYRELSEKYSFNPDDSFESYEISEVLNLFTELGYKASFDKKEKFFKIVDEIDSYKFQFNTSLRYGLVEFIWAVWKNNELQTGLPWGMLKQLLDGNDDDKIKKPVFRNYTDLKEILKDAFSMYDDFKRELVLVYESQL
ncbi:hypothetical protein J2Z22_003286 [Paenibacillus forsythiae]|uniref:Uncharacterized protein n=1 Tax=Paenibacillus forsythiae TaxID=365616 RepID=A0ABU3HDG1_9BACL|nr:hypothetical protein [Paenibacillus forsythiae]MDT3427710.1 hypothetical protein [Paenibacillus forsythiae]